MATLFGPVPVMMVARVFRANYGAPGIAGSVNSVGYLMLQQINSGYSTAATLSPSGSIVDFAVVQGNASVGEENAADPIFTVPGGYSLVGVASAGSVIMSGVYDLRYGRGV